MPITKGFSSYLIKSSNPAHHSDGRFYFGSSNKGLGYYSSHSTVKSGSKARFVLQITETSEAGNGI